jgi:hypothetical protein
MGFASLLAMPYYIQLSQRMLAPHGFEGASIRHTGIISSIVSAAAWLVSWRVGLAVQAIMLVLWIIV